MNFKRVLSALLALVLWPATAGTLKPEEIYQKLLPSVMTLEVENTAGETYVGAGFLALQTNVVVTSWHVVSDAAHVTAKFSDHRVVEVAGVIDKDERHDLALLKLEAGGIPPVRICATNPPVGARAYAIGSPKGYELSITDGLISQIQKVDGFSQFQVSCPISGGNSGGPLLNERGEVIGVVCWTKKDAQGLSFATPAAFLAGLDPTLPAVPWKAGTNSPATVQSTAQPARDPATPARSAGGTGTVAELRELLKKSAGREVTFVVIDQGVESRFTITVPDDLVK